MNHELRTEIVSRSKDYKNCWLKISEYLYVAWKDKLYEYWGYEKFDHFTEKEAGIKRSVAMKMVKCYSFIENNEPQYQKNGLFNSNPSKMPDIDSINVLRSARMNGYVTKEDYKNLRNRVFNDGIDATTARKDLKAIIKERKPLDQKNEIEAKKIKSSRSFVNSFRKFRHDATTMKIVPKELIEKIQKVIEEIEDFC